MGVAPDFYKTKDIHIHVPEGATPKDGPSAGVSILTSLTSALSGRPVHRDIAMTGELTLTGRVLAIGGLKEKTTAAWSAGVTRVIIPYDNRADLEEIDPVVRQNLLFIPCRDAGEVLRTALCTEKAETVRSETSKDKQKAKEAFSTLIPAGNVRIPTAVR